MAQRGNHGLSLIFMDGPAQTARPDTRFPNPHSSPEAAGFIGSHLTERRLDLGWNVIALDAITDYYDPSAKRANLAAAATRSNRGRDAICWSRICAHGRDRDDRLSPRRTADVRESWDRFDSTRIRA